MDLGYRVLRAPVGPKPIRARLEVRLENGFEHRLEARLHHPISHGGDSEFAELPARLRNHHLSHLHRTEPARLQLDPDLVQECLHPILDSIKATVARSTPAVRAPTLLATRSHACTKNAGS